MSETVFSKILKGEIPSYKVYEDEYTYAFLDISQVSKGHTLVIPKNAAPDMLSIDPSDLQHVITSVQKVAKAVDKAFQPDGINVIQNNRAFADQSVFHLHFHIIPRYKDDVDGFGYVWETHPDTLDMESLKTDIANAIE
ncbi:HIT family protein [Macrococcoides canis]|uniref:HIT-like protein n=1 Tax=Macrococcoides canis TaxID=1855823 RepID=A0A1W7ADA7_9STAP|nr:HIT family protein [Macrococcus canis]ARQ07582.1 HIT-like protein [Macrococcus canis]QIH76525.1 HIT domain-containing protein [Macrococcus canis]QTQ07611.1 HIT family protein [Macrococcus canis]QUR95112.1 HIT domain-containing protein [Macrococcus canis]UTG99605.1 HIT family protein [Macrococcus canis]